MPQFKSEFYIDHDQLILYCKKHLESLHCILWQGWTLEDDVVKPDGTIVPKGTTKAAEWLTDQIEAVFKLIEDG